MSTTNITSRSESEYTRAKKNRRARKRILGEFIRVLVMIALVLITLIPFYISVIYSIKYKNEITINHLAWPKNPTFNNYLRVITENQQFLIGLKNSVFKSKKITGLKDGKEIENLCNKMALRKQIMKISDVTMPLVIPSVDITESKEYIFTNKVPENVVDNSQYITDISVGKAVRASSSFPAVFNPCMVKEHAFLDGGVLDNIPVNEVKKQGADKIIAVKFDSEKIDNKSNIMDIVMKTIDIMGSKISEESLEISDFILNVYTDKVGLLDVKKLDSCYKYGYNAVIENIDRIKELFQ